MIHKTYQGQTNDLALFFKLEGIKKMNKLNNNEALQITTVIPTMKKSLLALAVAGTMAMSGAFAADVAGDGATTTAAMNFTTGTNYTLTSDAAITMGERVVPAATA